MKAITNLVGRLPGWASLMVAMTLLGHGSPTWAQAALCSPACGPGQSCVQGICMVPAPSQPAYPPPPQGPPQPQYQPPAGYQQFPPPAPSYSSPPPPAGYPQAAPPPSQAYPPAQPGTYQAAPANVYSPPPSGAYPPPSGSYPPPSGYYPPPPPNGLSQRRGFLALPFLGIHSFRGKTGEGLDVGLRLGVLLGGHINEMFSANGELTIDALNLSNPGPGVDASGGDVVIAFSPLVHVPLGPGEIAVGPKLGFRAGSTTLNSGGAETKRTSTGYVFGVNAGFFAVVSHNVSLGGLFSAEIRSVHEYCVTLPGAPEACSTNSALTGDADKVIGLAGAALF